MGTESRAGQCISLLLMLAASLLCCTGCSDRKHGESTAGGVSPRTFQDRLSTLNSWTNRMGTGWMPVPDRAGRLDVSQLGAAIRCETNALRRARLYACYTNVLANLAMFSSNTVTRMGSPGPGVYQEPYHAVMSSYCRFMEDACESAGMRDYDYFCFKLEVWGRLSRELAVCEDNLRTWGRACWNDYAESWASSDSASAKRAFLSEMEVIERSLEGFFPVETDESRRAYERFRLVVGREPRTRYQRRLQHAGRTRRGRSSVAEGKSSVPSLSFSTPDVRERSRKACEVFVRGGMGDGKVQRARMLESLTQAFRNAELSDLSYEARLESLDACDRLAADVATGLMERVGLPEEVWNFRLAVVDRVNAEIERCEKEPLGGPYGPAPTGAGGFVSQRQYMSALLSRRFSLVRDGFEYGPFTDYFHGLSEELRSRWIDRLEKVAHRRVVIWDPKNQLIELPADERPNMGTGGRPGESQVDYLGGERKMRLFEVRQK